MAMALLDRRYQGYHVIEKWPGLDDSGRGKEVLTAGGGEGCDVDSRPPS